MSKSYKILFFSPHITVRGTEVTMYDFADYAEKLLGHKSYITYVANHPENDQTAIDKFVKRFGDRVVPFEVPGITKFWTEKTSEIKDGINATARSVESDYFYVQKKGDDDGIHCDECKSVILCCGVTCQPHGHRYGYVSPWLSKVASNGEYPCVPTPVYLPDVEGDLREEFGIPKEATVFSRMGGNDTWNLPFANQVVEAVVNHRQDCYFMFMNTPKFVDHPRVIFLPANADMEYKTKFIQTADALLHCRLEGESFGLTCAEYSIKNKPVITWWGSSERNHIEILGEKGVYYKTPQDLADILCLLKPMPDRDWNAYKDYAPEKVMQVFSDKFLDNE